MFDVIATSVNLKSMILKTKVNVIIYNLAGIRWSTRMCSNAYSCPKLTILSKDGFDLYNKCKFQKF